MMQRLRSFTLIEVLLVIVIFGILVSVTSYSYLSSLARSRDSQRLSDLAIIKNALEQLYLDHRQYPFFDRPNGGSWIFAARWQLSRDGVPNCKHLPNINKIYLAPTYLSLVPEDPLHKLSIKNNCYNNDNYNHNGQYLYLSSPDSGGEQVEGKFHHAKHPATGYWLLAKLEQQTRVNLTDNPFANGFYYNRYGFPRSNIQLPPASPASHNYFLENSRND